MRIRVDEIDLTSTKMRICSELVPAHFHTSLSQPSIPIGTSARTRTNRYLNPVLDSHHFWNIRNQLLQAYKFYIS